MKFKKADWIFNTDVYEVNLRQYSEEGSINAFLKELPRLKEMGVSTLWFMPITPIAQKNKKGTLGSQYACSNYTAVSDEVGSIADFKIFVSQAHEMGFKVIIDWVANHTGWDHVWTISNPEYYKFDTDTCDFKKASGMDDIIELDYQNQELRNAMIAAMRFWITEFDIDGFRCDLAFWVQLDFWIEARVELEKTKTVFWLAESDPIENPDYFQAFDACYTWRWMHQSASFYKDHRNKNMLDEVLMQYNQLDADDNIFLWFTSNHDENTWNGTEYEKYGDAAKTFAVFSFTWNGVPLIYSGQELPNYKRLQFFDKDVIEWSNEYALHDFYKTLLALHKTNPALRAADVMVCTFMLTNSAENEVMVYLRKNDNDEVLVLLNLSDQKINCVINDERLGGKFIEIFSKAHFEFGSTAAFELAPWGYLVFEKAD